MASSATRSRPGQLTEISQDIRVAQIWYYREQTLSIHTIDILTRPLGANIGDFLASARSDGGLGLGTFGTSLVFLTTILAVVIYLTKTQADRTEIVHKHRE